MKRVLAVLVVLSSAAVLAQQQPERPPQRTQQQRVQQIPFDEGDVIDGTGARPDLDDISVVKRPDFGNLIRVRQNFDEKVMDSASQLP